MLLFPCVNGQHAIIRAKNTELYLSHKHLSTADCKCGLKSNAMSLGTEGNKFAFALFIENL